MKKILDKSKLKNSIISNFDTKVKNNLIKWRTKQSKSVNKKPK